MNFYLGIIVENKEQQQQKNLHSFHYGASSKAFLVEMWYQSQGGLS